MEVLRLVAALEDEILEEGIGGERRGEEVRCKEMGGIGKDGGLGMRE